METIKLLAKHSASGSINLPGSKSISNRTLLLAALAENDTDIYELLVSDDTERMLDALKILGIVTEKSNTHLHVKGCNGNFPIKNADLFLGNAGTAFRPLTAALALSKGHYHLHGVSRMHERPIGDLVDALIQIGANIEYAGNKGFPPLRISPCIPDLSKPIKIRGNVSSQFLTAMLMALPLAGKESEIEVVGDLISKPYIDITLNLMRKFNVEVQCDNYQRFIIPANSIYYSPKDLFVEGDASSASYFLAAGAIAAKNGSSVIINGVDLNSIQGDIKFVYEIEKMGAIFNKQDAEIGHISVSAPTRLKAIDLDCNHIPDAAMTLAILALFADGTTTLRNIASWRVKETDRIAAMATELRKVGAIVEEGADYIKITPPAQLTPNAVIDTYDDHRMAMCFSLVSLGGVPITINDPKCVAKTFPNYFAEFAKIVK